MYFSATAPTTLFLLQLLVFTLGISVIVLWGISLAKISSIINDQFFFGINDQEKMMTFATARTVRRNILLMLLTLIPFVGLVLVLIFSILSYLSSSKLLLEIERMEKMSSMEQPEESILK